jgi:hypothetical protein
LASPVLGQKNLGAKLLACPGRQIINLPGATTFLGPALTTIVITAAVEIIIIIIIIIIRTRGTTGQQLWYEHVPKSVETSQEVKVTILWNQHVQTEPSLITSQILKSEIMKREHAC